MTNLFRHIPAVDKLLLEPQVKEAARGLPSQETTEIVRSFLDRIRSEIAAQQGPVSQEEIVARLVSQLELSRKRRFQPVINATGVLLHTNLGRAPLPQEALDRIAQLELLQPGLG